MSARRAAQHSLENGIIMGADRWRGQDSELRLEMLQLEAVVLTSPISVNNQIISVDACSPATALAAPRPQSEAGLALTRPAKLGA